MDKTADFAAPLFSTLLPSVPLSARPTADHFAAASYLNVNLIFCKTLHFIEGKKNRHIPRPPLLLFLLLSCCTASPLFKRRMPLLPAMAMARQKRMNHNDFHSTLSIAPRLPAGTHLPLFPSYGTLQPKTCYLYFAVPGLLETR